MGITNTQYDALMRVYEKRQIDNHDVEEARRARAYEAIPQLSQLDRAVASLSVKAVKDALAPDGGSAFVMSSESFQKALREAAGGMDPDERRRSLLREHSFPEDYLDPVYTCKDCRDTGWIGNRHCHCFEKEMISLFYTQSGLAQILKEENFDTFDLSYYPTGLIDEKTKKSSREIMTDALSTCRVFTREFGRGTGNDNLLLTGAAGLGKTFLTHCIAKELIDKGHSVIYYSAGELFRLIADSRFGRMREEDEERSDEEYLYGCDLLIIDDLGTELTNTFVGTALFELLNERISRRKGIVISTNLPLQEIGMIYSERISSRLVENFTMIRVFGQDIRIQKAIGKLSH